MSCCGSAGAAADDDDDDDAADGAGFVVAVGGAAWGLLVLILVLFSDGAADGATDVSPPNSCPMSGAAELLRPLRGTRVGIVMTGTAGVVSCRSFHDFWTLILVLVLLVLMLLVGAALF